MLEFFYLQKFIDGIRNTGILKHKIMHGGNTFDTLSHASLSIKTVTEGKKSVIYLFILFSELYCL